MKRLTEYHCGVAVIKDKSKLAEAMTKLAEYENTGLTPEAMGGWNPIEERLPPDDRYVLLSFANFSLPMIGRYHDDAFYLGDCDGEDTCVVNDLFVNAWLELPDPYTTNEGE